MITFYLQQISISFGHVDYNNKYITRKQLSQSTVSITTE